MLYWIIFIVTMLLSFAVQTNLKLKFKKYSKLPVVGNLTGAEVARRMLQQNGIMDVQVTSTNGFLTDHYNPANKTINLSEGVYNSSNVMAAAVAAHECGHALQHAQSYAPLRLRSALVPVVHFASQWVMWVILVGMFVIDRYPQLMLIGIILFAFTTLFSLITLPVEINASRRALVWLENARITTYDTHADATRALRAAAYTYIVAALSSLATLFYYIMLYLGHRD